MTSSGKIKSWQKVVNVDENAFSAQQQYMKWEHQDILGSKTLHLKIDEMFYCLFMTSINESLIKQILRPKIS